MSTDDFLHDEVAVWRGTRPQTVAASPVAGSGRTGVASLVTVAVAYPALWVLVRPGGQPLDRFRGELCGAKAVLLFSCSLVLASLLAPIERAFGGLDRVAVWHHRPGEAGVLLRGRKPNMPRTQRVPCASWHTSSRGRGQAKVRSREAGRNLQRRPLSIGTPTPLEAPMGLGGAESADCGVGPAEAFAPRDVTAASIDNWVDSAVSRSSAYRGFSASRARPDDSRVHDSRATRTKLRLDLLDLRVNFILTHLEPGLEKLCARILFGMPLRLFGSSDLDFHLIEWSPEDATPSCAMAESTSDGFRSTNSATSAA